MSETAEQQTQEQSQPEQNGVRESDYVIFKRTGGDSWQELGVVSAIGAYNARLKAVEEFGLMAEVRDGSLEMVSLGRRFWLPKKPKVSVSESVDVG